MVAPRFMARAGVLSSLGLETRDMEVNGFVIGSYIPADANGATSVAGVWVAGNVSDLQAQVITSAAAGLKAGAMINADLIAEETKEAVAALRARGHVKENQEGATLQNDDSQIERFWEEHYQKRERVWSGRANAALGSCNVRSDREDGAVEI